MNIDEICEKYNIKGYTINEDGSIDVNRPVNLNRRGLTELPVKFNIIHGSFDCSDNRLTTLKGMANKIEGSLFIEGNDTLDKLDYLPNEIGHRKGLFLDIKFGIGKPINNRCGNLLNIDNNYKMMLRKIRISNLVDENR